MEGICIVGNNSWEGLARQLHAQLFPAPKLNNDIREALDKQDRQIEADCIIHQWLHRLPKDNNAPIIIDLDDDHAIGFLVAMHIRLSLETLELSALRPIVCVSELPIEMLLPSHPFAQLLCTGGTYFCRASDVVKRIEFFKPLAIESYNEKFLSKVVVRPPAELGRHSLANLWGAGVLYRLTHEGDACPDDFGFLSIVNKVLYLKYVLATTRDIQSLVFKNRIVRFAGIERINASGKRILFLDDSAKAGWADALRAFFANADAFEIIDKKVSCFDGYDEEEKELILNGNFDLVLLDLRLDGNEEEDVVNPDAFSGMDVLRSIKEANRGTQVIIFTASNKAWNFKTLMDSSNGANGYFIKESPESRFTSRFSVANLKSFKREVENCFNRGYLRDFFSFKESVKSMIGSGVKDELFVRQLYSQLEIAYKMADCATSQETYQYAFLSVFQVLEMINNHFVHVDNDEKAVVLENNEEKPVGKIELKNGSILYSVNSDAAFEDSLWARIGVILLCLCKRTDDGLIHLTRQIIKLRNDFIHKDPRFGSARVMTLNEFYMHKDALNPELVFSAPDIHHIMESMASKNMLFTWSRQITMNRAAITDKEGIEITIAILKRIFESIKTIL